MSACANQRRLCNIRKQNWKSWRKEKLKFSIFSTDFLGWNFNSQSDFVLISIAFFQLDFPQRDATWNLFRISWLCYIEFSFSKTVLSSWWESTAAFSSATCRSSCPEVFCEKGVLRNFSKFTERPLCQSLFCNKV